MLAIFTRGHLVTLGGILGLAIGAGLCGCGRSADTTNPRAKPKRPGAAPPPVVAAEPPASPSPALVSPTDPNARETWDVVLMQGSRVGYVRSLEQRVVEGGEERLRCTQESSLSILRGKDQVVQRFSHVSTETPEGRLLSFESQVQLGPTPTVTRGRVESGKLVIELAAGGKPQVSSIPWDDKYGGFAALEQNLRREPLQPDEKRTIQALMPVVNRVATVELEAGTYEPTDLLNGQLPLLHVDARLKLAEPVPLEMPMVLWCDIGGEVRKSYMPGVEQVTYRVTREEALASPTVAPIDVLRATIVPVAEVIPNAYRTREVKYRVTLDGGDPAKAFAAGGTQEVHSTGPHTAEITVRSVRPGEAGPAESAEPPGSGDTRPTTMLQSDDPQVAALAREAAAAEQDPAKLAVRLESFVHRRLAKKNFTQVLASAAEAARSLEGDCTEHAVLLAALCRARGLPARVAIGLVYLGAEPAFGFHMWTEAYLDGRWVPLDATLGQGGIGAVHLKVAHSNLDGADALATLLPVAQLIGRLKIHVESVQ